MKVAEVNRVVRELERRDYTVDRPRRGGHWTVRGPDGTWVHSLSSSPRSGRALVELRAAVRRYERERQAVTAA